MIMTKLFPGLVAVSLAALIAAILILAYADRVLVRFETIASHFGG